MRLSDYQWSHNPRGMHNSDFSKGIDTNRMIQIKAGWVKMVAIDREHLTGVPVLLAHNITPIVRVYIPRPGAAVPTPDLIRAWKEYYRVGVRWFEFYNEPNFEIEWPVGSPPSYTDTDNVIAPLMQHWMDWAEMIIDMGAYPAFPALGEQIGSAGDVTSWLDAMLLYLAENYYERFRSIADNGMWCATHPYYYNHFYQEGGGPLTPRQPGEERADEGGWHFEYPFDPVNQSQRPGITTISGPPDYPRGDPIGLTGMGHAFMSRFSDIFGGGAVPVIGTEGGMTPPPEPSGKMNQADTRYPGFNWSSHAEATLAAFNWIAEQGPPWMFGLTLWIENEYFDAPGSTLPAVQRMATSEPVYKTVPPIEALDGPGPGYYKFLKGPGPIHGTPDYHFVIIAPGFNTNWFFSEASDYWAMFRPTLLSATDYIAYIPPKKSLACTVLATPDLVDYMTHHIKERWPNVYFDLITATDVGTIVDVLQERTSSGRRFG
ncbi:MAG: hypothetical protein ABI947_10395 [Chloroflexota bacterium]